MHFLFGIANTSHGEACSEVSLLDQSIYLPISHRGQTLGEIWFSKMIDQFFLAITQCEGCRDWKATCVQQWVNTASAQTDL